VIFTIVELLTFRQQRRFISVFGWPDSLESEIFARAKLKINEISGNYVPETPEICR
jgi:hypothetical protein